MPRHSSIRTPIGLAVAVIVTAIYLPTALSSNHDDRPAAEQSIGRGEVLFARGQYEGAVAEWTRAYRHFSQTGDNRGQVATLARRAEAYQALGFYKKSIDDFTEALALAAVLGDEAQLARLRGGLGSSLYRAGHPEAAEQMLRACLSYAKTHNDKELLALALNSWGNLREVRPSAEPANGAERPEGAALPPFENLDAEGAYRASNALAREAGNPELVATARLNRARQATLRGDLDAGVRQLEETLEAFRELPSSSSKARALIAVGRLLGRVDRERQVPSRVGLIYGVLDEAHDIAREIGDRASQSYALGYLAQLYEKEGRIDEALRLTQRALFSANDAGAPEILYLWQWQAGRLYKQLQDINQAIGAYREAVDTLRAIRGEMIGYGGRLSFREAVGPVFLELTDLLLEESARSTDPLRVQQALLEARRTMELLKTAELEDYFQDECVAALEAKVKPIDELGDRTAALYPILFPERTELLVSLPGGLTRATVAVGAETVIQQVRDFRHQLENRTTRQYLGPARKLYDWLIRPIESELERARVQTLIVIPGGALRTVPLSALHDGRRHLIEKYATGVAPGLTLLDPRPLQAQEVKVLLSGLTESVQGFSPLPHVENELQRVHAIFGGKLFKDETFLSREIQQALDEQPYSVVHIASHAQFKSDAASSFLLTYDGRLTMDGLEEFIKLSQFRDEPVELLTLSACATAAGDDRAALGLAGISIKAGARSALASLWFINDQATSVLISEFYEQLRDPTRSKAQALQRAQWALLSDSRYSHPGYWAPFLLIGNWL